MPNDFESKTSDTAQQAEPYNDALEALKKRYQQAEQMSSEETKKEARKLPARNPDEFCVGVEAPPYKAPALCPNCSSAANAPTHIFAYNYNYDAGTTILFGILGQLFRFLLIGSSSKTLLTAVTCERCRRFSRLFKGLEWVCRVGGILMTGVLIVMNSTSALPLLERGVGLLLLSLSPLALGAILALVFRNLSGRCKGITYKRSDGNVNWFRVRSAEWLREFTRSRESALKDALQVEQDQRVANYIQATMSAWSDGKLAGLSEGFKTEADGMQMADFIRKYPPYAGTSLRVYFEEFTPLEGEFIIGMGDPKTEETCSWFVLTNRRLIQKDGGSDQYRAITLADIDSYQIKRRKKDTLVFKMKSGEEITFEKTLCYPHEKYLSWAIAQSIVA